MAEVSLFLAFGAGLLSFLSPCSLPLYPAFLSYITGMSVDEIKTERGGIFKTKAFTHTIIFLLGFSVIFLAIGLSTTFLGQFFLTYQDLLRQFGAIILVFFGLVLTGVLRFDFIMKDRKLHFSKRPAGYVGSFMIGIGFAAGWTPCTGPILAAVIAMGVVNPGMGLIYMIIYVLGFSIPFLLMTFFIDRMNFFKKHSNKFMFIGGFLMIIMGIILFFDWLTVLIEIMIPWFGGFTGF